MKKWFSLAAIILGVLAVLTLSIGPVTPVIFAALGVIALGIANFVP